MATILRVGERLIPYPHQSRVYLFGVSWSRSKSVFVVNHALLSGDPAHFAVLSVYVGDPADPLSQP